ncbi:MAG: hypothetical protein ABJA11_11545, partial [Pseudolysinimonas sp.]
MSGRGDTLKVVPKKVTGTAAGSLRPRAAGRRAKDRRPPSPGGFFIIAVSLCWLTIGIAAASLWPIYQTGRYAVLVAVAMLVGTVIAILGTRFRWPSWALVTAGFAAFLAVGVPVAVPDEAVSGVLPSIQGIIDLVSGIALGWKQLLTITLPVGTYQALLVPALLLVLSVTIVSISIALRSKWGELAVIPPVLLLLVGIVFGPERIETPEWLALALMGVTLLTLVWRRWRRRREAIRQLALSTPDAKGRPLETAGESGLGVRGVLAGGVILLLAGGASIAASSVLQPTGGRDVLRTAVAQPFDPRDYSSPLSGFRRYLRDDKSAQVQFQISGLPSGALIRVATLDSYDGVVFAVGSSAVDSASGTFVRIPSSVDQNSTQGTAVKLRVTLTGYSGVWLPTVGRFESVAFSGADAARLGDGFYYNNTSGTAAVVSGLHAGDSYTLRAVLPDEPTSAQLDTVTPGSAS